MHITDYPDFLISIATGRLVEIEWELQWELSGSIRKVLKVANAVQTLGILSQGSIRFSGVSLDIARKLNTIIGDAGFFRVHDSKSDRESGVLHAGH